MAYQVWSVVFGEQPSASKWNILGTNDAGFHDGSNIDDDAIIARHIADDVLTAGMIDEASLWGWEVLADITAGASTTMTANPISSRRYLKIIINNPYDANANGIDIRFNNDSGNNYAHNRILLGVSTDNASVSSSEVNPNYRGGFSITDVIDISGQAKPIFTINSSYRTGVATTASDVPACGTYAGKWTGTANITRIDAIRRTNNFVSGARMIVLGRN